MTNFEDWNDHYADDDDEDGEQFKFECAAYVENGRWICPLAGTEDCDWECPEGSITEVRKGRL